MKYLFILITLIACTDTQEGYPEVGPVDTRLSEWVPTFLEVNTRHLDTEAYRVGCNYLEEYSTLPVDLSGSRPHIVSYNPPAPCDPLERYRDAWHLHCRQKVISDFFTWHNDFSFVFSETAFGRTKGILYFWLDGGTYEGEEYFWCLHSLEITDFQFEWERI